jgi:ribose/xylose/arabinose/galactoside ABC-type transport system permease subunit
VKKVTFRDSIGKQSTLAILVVLVVILSVTTPSFRTVGNMVNILKQVSIIGIISCGMTLVVISGCLDLSVGSVFSLLNVIIISLQQRSNMLAVAVALIVAILIGLFNGVIITAFDMNSIIVTLGSLSLIGGLALLYTNGAIIHGISDTWFSVIGKDRVFGIPIHVLVFLFVAILYQLLLSGTSLGKKIRYVGVNPEAARIAGIRTGKIRTLTFIISSLSVAVAAIIYSSRMVTGSPVTGVGYEFSAITALVVGGISLRGGSGSIFGTIIGVLILAVIVNALTLYNVPYGLQNIVKGFLIIIAIIADIRARREIEF